MKIVRLMMLDDHALVLAGLCNIVQLRSEFMVVGCFTDGQQLLDALVLQPVDVLLLDYELAPGMLDGLSLIAQIHRTYPNLKILVISAVHSEGKVITAIRAGALGFISKSVECDELIKAIRIVARGRNYIGPEMGLKRFQSGNAQQLEGMEKLSPREREVLRCFLRGMSVSEIATLFNRSIKTISSQKQSAITKLGLHKDHELFLMGSVLIPNL
ncbi:response regulator [Aeromonas caviae]|uniref:response regulator n=1 Tax=Aeromonas caviae TaxID=648 RepID=UPI002257D63C|nr:response regulator transcription factor [Aeromonas caviae]MCX4032413.1 response regulator transcription factor [Aeromonas caviae]